MYKIEELITIHNNLARRKGIRQIPVGKRMTFTQIADKIEAINKIEANNPQPIPKRWDWLFHRRLK